MRLSLVTAAALSAMIVATPVLAKDKKPQDPNKRICRSEVPTGSMMSKSVCHTRAEWQSIDEQNQAATDQAIRSRRTNSQ
jgi:predicted secreted protein